MYTNDNSTLTVNSQSLKSHPVKGVLSFQNLFNPNADISITGINFCTNGVCC